MHCEWGIKTASQRRWHFRRRMCIYNFLGTFFGSGLGHFKPIKADILLTALELGKKRRCKILSFHSCQQQASESQMLPLQSQVPHSWLRGELQVHYFEPTHFCVRVLFSLGHTLYSSHVIFFFWISGVYRSVYEFEILEF